MLWINFLHCYQPANADAYVIKEATDKCYRRLVRILEKNPDIKFTFNLTGCLFLRWEELNNFDVIDGFKKLIERGQIELTGTAAYHPILPLIPEPEIVRQIKENEAILKKFLGLAWQRPEGFFLPEMAYSKRAAKIIKSLGYKWLILDEIALSKGLGRRDLNKIYLDKDSGLKIIFRDRNLSRKYVPGELLGMIGSKDKRTCISATDGELYGLRHIDYTGKLEKLLGDNDLKTATMSEFIGQSKEPIKIKLRSSNWESTEEELIKKAPFILWRDKKNLLHTKLWRLAGLAYKATEKFKNDNNYYWARWHLVRGLSSCTFWWASARDFKLFSAISWNPDIIERGTNELIRSIRSIDDEKSRRMKIVGEKLHLEIKRLIWKRHWTDFWKK